MDYSSNRHIYFSPVSDDRGGGSSGNSDAGSYSAPGLRDFWMRMKERPDANELEDVERHRGMEPIKPDIDDD